MVDLADNPSIGRVLELQHDADKTIAALCHGPAALLSAPDSDGVWLFDGYKMTAFTNEGYTWFQVAELGYDSFMIRHLRS